MKSLFIIHAIAGLLYVVGGIWTAISLILYLVKDIPFDWTSVIVSAYVMVIALLNMFRMFFRKRTGYLLW